MSCEENNPSDDFQPADGHENDDDTGISSSSSSSQPPARRSRFFRSRRKLRTNQEETPSQDNHNESTCSSESPEQSNEERPKISSGKTARRSPSPPPPASTDDTDETSTSDESKLSTSIEDLNVSTENHQQQPTEEPSTIPKPVKEEKSAAASTKLSTPPSIYAGYQRKKSQSVKLTRIDPMEPCPKKAVRFADDFGLDLSQVKVIKSDELPHVPSAAFKHLQISAEDNSDSSTPKEKTKVIHYLEQQFENPIHVHGFDDRVQRHRVVLEQANAIDNRIYGTIKLLSFGMNKRVKIRLTTDGWNTHYDYEAHYIPNSHDGTFDRFSFTLDVDRARIYPGNVVEFCISYETFVGPEFWDSNYQQNYRFSCVSRTIPDYSS